MSAFPVQLLFLGAAFWVAIAHYRAPNPTRFGAGLALGAVLAHIGWRLLLGPGMTRSPGASFEPCVGVGFSVLFLPIGPLLLTPSAAAFRILPLALAVARAGCLAAGCCHGPDGEPLPIAEIVGLLALHRTMLRLRGEQVVPCALVGLGVLRLGIEPLRASPIRLEPLLPPEWIAGAWIALGLAGGLRIRALRARSEARPNRPPSGHARERDERPRECSSDAG